MKPIVNCHFYTPAQSCLMLTVAGFKENLSKLHVPKQPNSLELGLQNNDQYSPSHH